MDVIVKKFGGTSVGSVEKIKSVARRIVDDLDTHPNQVIVVSAMGSTTDHLVQMAKEISNDEPPAREYDALVSTGENVSASLLSMAIQTLGRGAISLSGPQAGIKTEPIYSKAKIIDVQPNRIFDELNKGKVVIVTGFQGLNEHNDIVTIGRGGSDTSAVALAAALKCNMCEIYTDVDGIYTTDPRKVPSAKKLSEIANDEMLELASLGAKVLHPRSVEVAKEYGITIHVRSSFDSVEGTLVKEASEMEVKKPVTGVTMNENEVIISLLGVKDDPGTASKLFTELANESINVDMIVQSTEENRSNTITFTVQQDDIIKARRITESVAQQIGARGVKVDEKVAKVSIVGVGMISRSGVAAQMFRCLGEAGVNIHLISTSEIKISCAVDLSKATEAVKLLHAEFSLDK